MNPTDLIHISWEPVKVELYQEPMTTLSNKILPNCSYQPMKEDIFRVFSMPVKEVKVVILGMDPYPTPGNACGWSFINGLGKIPKSLQIIYNEIDDSIVSPCEIIDWPKQGVFMLNSALTVETGNAGSHIKYWKNFTKRVITHLSLNNPCIWVMWGKKAQDFIPHISNKFEAKGYDRETIEEIPISNDFNYILTAPHPAAEAYAGGKAGFYGCDHFYMVNKILEKKSFQPIIW